MEKRTQQESLKTFYAKSVLKNGNHPTVKEHLQGVSQLAAQFGAEFGREQEAETAGMFHDIGKYSDSFQGVLKGTRQHIDHAFSSAALLYGIKKKPAYCPLVEAVNGHHDGLIALDELSAKLKGSIDSDEPKRSDNGKQSALTGHQQYQEALCQFQKDFPGYRPPKLKQFKTSENAGDVQKNIEKMLYTRFLFSCLVDADYSTSASEEDETYLDTAGTSDFDPKDLLNKLYQHRDGIKKKSTAEPEVNQIRDALFDQCGAMGEAPSGLFTLTAPTGAGKTLALLHFALRHCLANGQNRIIIVLPYLTLTEQNAAEYRNIVPDLLEDHSQSKLDDAQREFSARWSVPFIITTSVRFFETLFASQPTDCRKLHSIANSVVIFDEAQSLPPKVTIATLEAVKELCRSYKTTMVFSTATQPSFHAIEKLEWTPTEIVPNYPDLFQKLQRTQVQWRLQEPTPFAELAQEMAQQTSVCTIVNLRRHARILYESLIQCCQEEGCFFLTTDLCPAHRKKVVEQIRKRLEEGKPCRLVATQCIEAGVDFDFDCLYRALAPLESIIQAAGRCNRNGRLPEKGRVTVFLTEDEKYPGNWYEKAANIVKSENSKSKINIHDPKDIERYYQILFLEAGEEQKEPLTKAIKNSDYQETDKEYQLIDNQGVRIIVPYAEKMELFRRVQQQVLEQGITPYLMKLAAPITISVFDRKKAECYGENLLYPPRRHQEKRYSDYYIIREQYCGSDGENALYTEKMGLQFPTNQTDGEVLFL
jgi:CRISPR-associated helicase Cas3/CRISPR-associated endonuclease Cas3-HD